MVNCPLPFLLGDNSQSFRVQGELWVAQNSASRRSCWRQSPFRCSDFRPWRSVGGGFGASLNAANWVVSNEGLGAGEGDSTVGVEDGNESLHYALSDGWAGASAKTKDGYRCAGSAPGIRG